MAYKKKSKRALEEKMAQFDEAIAAAETPANRVALIQQQTEFVEKWTRNEWRLARLKALKSKAKATDSVDLDPLANFDADEPFEVDTTPAPIVESTPAPTPELTPEQKAAEEKARKFLASPIGTRWEDLDAPKSKSQSAQALEAVEQTAAINRQLENGLGWTRTLSAMTPLEVPDQDIPFAYRPAGPADSYSSLGPNGAPWNPWDADVPVETDTFVRNEHGEMELQSSISARQKAAQKAESERRDSLLYGGGRNQPW